MGLLQPIGGGTGGASTVSGTVGNIIKIGAGGVETDSGVSSTAPTFSGTVTAPSFVGTLTGNATNITGSIPESQVTNLVSDLALKSPLASPTFTGVVTAPTFVGALTGNATSITGSITESQVTNLVSDLALKSPSASPTFTGIVTTPAINGNSGTGLTINGNSSSGITFSAGPIAIGDNSAISFGTTAGTAIGTSSTQKIAFFGGTPVVRPSGSLLTALGTSGLGLVSTPTIAEADVTNLVSDLALKANLASPTFTGTVTAPTFSGALTGNATSITGSITESQVTNLVSDLALKSPLASPTFTGTVTAPTFSGALTGNATSITGSITESQVTNLVSDLALKAPLSAPTFTTSVTLTDGINIVIGTTTGTQFGTATTQKIGFFAATPIVRPSGSLLTAIAAIGLISAPTIAEGDITNLVSDLALKSPIASPTFTGTVTAPTFVGALTGNATGLSANITESQVTNLVSDLALKAPLASPTFTGTVTAINIIDTGTYTAGAAGFDKPVSITPTYNQTSTAKATDLFINRTESAVGSGAQLLIDAQVGGTSKFSVARTGALTVAAGGAVIKGDCSFSGTNTNTSNQNPFAVFDSVGNPLLVLNSYGTNNNTVNIGGQTLLQMFNSQAKFANGCSIASFNAPIQFCDPLYSAAFAKSSGTDIAVQVTPTYTQTSTAAATDLLITRTETSIGSGAQLLVDAQVGGVSKFSVDRNGTLLTNGLDHTSTVQINAFKLYSGF